MTPDEQDPDYTAAKASHEKVVRLGNEYQEATVDRARRFRRLKDKGWSLYKIGKLLGLSPVRVSQIASRPDKPERRQP